MTNAEIYFSSAQNAMARNMAHCNMYIQAFKIYCAEHQAESRSYSQQIDLVLLNVRHQVTEMRRTQPYEGWALNDYDSVTWFLGMFAKGMAEYLNKPYQFHDIFVDSFNRHFSQYGMQ